MILPGTEKMQRYSFTEDIRGILVYGTSKDRGRTVYKIPLGEDKRVQALGYYPVKHGRGYAYVVR